MLAVANCNEAPDHHEGAPVIAFAPAVDRLAVLALAVESGLQADDSGNWTVLDGFSDGFGARQPAHRLGRRST